jgi:Ni,Fe-hydrogenase III small subunit/Pyruvate/2-oxoacid:ferredoxin oxidoreductase delta subunit
MINIIRARLAQGYKTARYPQQPPTLPDRFRGLPKIDSSKCTADCTACAAACPTAAIIRAHPETFLDMGECLFCGACERACAQKAIQFTPDHALAASSRTDLQINQPADFHHARRLEPERLRLFGRSIRLRQVSAGGCNACEADVNVLNTLVFDLSRFGIQFVASPRHADGLLVTGPVTKNMELALQKTYAATPSPKIVIATGACAISGGMFAKHNEVHKGVGEVIPVDLYIPGCPPHPYTILDGLLRLLGKVKNKNE